MLAFLCSAQIGSRAIDKLEPCGHVKAWHNKQFAIGYIHVAIKQVTTEL